VPVERFIDGYQSRNERLADLMRGMGICEEKSSGIDRVVQAAEVSQLPAPHFRTGHRRTVVTIYGSRPFGDMGREDRIRAYHQHCALKWVMAGAGRSRSSPTLFRSDRPTSITAGEAPFTISWSHFRAPARTLGVDLRRKPP